MFKTDQLSLSTLTYSPFVNATEKRILLSISLDIFLSKHYTKHKLTTVKLVFF